MACLLGRTVASNAEISEIYSRSLQWLSFLNTTGALLEISNFADANGPPNNTQNFARARMYISKIVDASHPWGWSK